MKRHVYHDLTITIQAGSAIYAINLYMMITKICEDLVSFSTIIRTLVVGYNIDVNGKFSNGILTLFFLKCQFTRGLIFRGDWMSLCQQLVSGPLAVDTPPRNLNALAA